MEPATPSVNAPTGHTVDAEIANARQFSRYLERTLTAEPQLLCQVDLREPLEVAFAPAELANARTRDELQRLLRRRRKQTMAALIVRDLAGWANLAEVTRTMTQLAQCTISAALDWVTRDLAQTLGTPRGAAGGPTVPGRRSNFTWSAWASLAAAN